jgi:hypothetical protein
LVLQEKEKAGLPTRQPGYLGNFMMPILGSLGICAQPDPGLSLPISQWVWLCRFLFLAGYFVWVKALGSFSISKWLQLKCESLLSGRALQIQQEIPKSLL